jgi:hypothetical protein
VNQMYERLKIQANIRRLVDLYGLDTALELYQKAIEKEMRYVDRQVLGDSQHHNQHRG